jgi:tRNA U34 5-carboxymethylaminomethyl modifying GTPase MnmE/TrmE
LPCLLVENKADLLDGDVENDPELQEFAKTNEFCGCFRTSAKTGLNISESMEFLIKTIVKRMEDMQNKGNEEVFSTERKSVALDPEKHNQAAATKRKKDKDGCC